MKKIRLQWTRNFIHKMIAFIMISRLLIFLRAKVVIVTIILKGFQVYGYGYGLGLGKGAPLELSSNYKVFHA